MNLLRSLAVLLAVGSTLVPVDGAKERLLRSRSLQTPDGETPATETVCDGYEGQAFGICNAFCEAKDCIYSPLEIKSCDKLREKWEELTDGTRLPCAPTMSPTTSPTMSPTKNPTESPTKNPTESPTKNPTESPTKNPTESPTKNPTESPTKNPTESPTNKPTESTENCGGEAPGVISNCLIKLGVNPTGNLIVPGGIPVLGETEVGLRYIFPTGLPDPEGETTSFGCRCEGWGVGVGGGESIFFNRSAGSSPASAYDLVNFLITGSTAVSTVAFANGKLQITHDYHPSPATPNLYEVTVTMMNTGANPIADLLYRRSMDWDVYPTRFNECVTIQPGPVADFVAASNNGFTNSNPYASLPGTPAPFVDLGPTDHGATFDFSFGQLAPGEIKIFNMYLGAGANQPEVEAALALVGAEVYSLGKPNSGGVCADTPNTYAMAFTGVGGPPILP